MRTKTSVIALSMGLTACAGPGGTGPGGGLMYRVPDPPSLTYVTGDTTNIDIDAGAMGNLRMRGTGTSTMAAAFSRSAEGIQVTARFLELDARLSQPMGGAQTATEADVAGDIVFALDARGHATVISLPEAKGAAAQLANPQALAYEFFPMLPGGVVNPGDTWTDTLSYEVEVDQGMTESTSIMTYTLKGDTVLEGRSLLLITVAGRADVVGSGVTEGMEVIQVFSGDVEGTVLWDPGRSVYVAGSFERDMDGTVEVPAAGMPPMPMTVRGRSHVRLQGN